MENALPKVRKEPQVTSVSEPEKTIVCLNCGTEYKGRFCPHCGQRHDVRRFNRAELIKSITRGLFNADRGFLYTLKMMCHRPGRVIRDYIDGKRVRYFPPFSLLFVVAAVYAVIKQIITFCTPETVHMQEVLDKVKEEATLEGIDLNNIVPEDAPLNIDTGAIFNLNDSPAINYVMDALQNNYALIVLLALPFFVLSMRICFRQPFRKQYNWAESFMIGAYLIAQYLIVIGFFGIVTLLFPSFEETGDFLSSLGLVCLMAWNMYDLTHFPKKRSYFWHSVGMAMLFFILVIFVLVLLACIFAFLFSIIHIK